MTTSAPVTATRRWAVPAVIALAALLLGACAAIGGGSHATGNHATSTHAAVDARTATQASATQASVVTRAGARSATVRHTFDPYRPDGSLRTPVARSVHGSCWTTSLAAPDAHTFRCLSGNSILDPCFARASHSTTVACVATPWSRAVVLHLTKRLPKPVATGSGRIWALTVSTGAGCVASTGTAAYVRGHNLSYDCPAGHAAEIVDPHARSMTAYYARVGGTALHRHAVRAVWRA